MKLEQLRKISEAAKGLHPVSPSFVVMEATARNHFDALLEVVEACKEIADTECYCIVDPPCHECGSCKFRNTIEKLENIK